MYSSWALKRAAKTIVEDMCTVQEKENVVILAETRVNKDVIWSVAEAAHLEGAKAHVFFYEEHPMVDVEPSPPMAAAMKSAEVNIEFASKYYIHTKAFSEALKAGARTLDLCDMSPEQIIRCIGQVDLQRVMEFGDTLAEMLGRSNKLEVTTPAGTSLTAEIRGRPIVHNRGRISKPGEYTYLPGQVSWQPVEDTITGAIVFDGSVWPPDEVNILKNPIKLEVEKGVIKEIEGSNEAKIWEKWLEGFNDPNMFKIAHFSYGFNPGAQLCGSIIEDERIFGCVELGIGFQFARFKGTVGAAPAHTDGIMLNPTVKLDGEAIEEQGAFIHPDLARIAKSLK